MGNKKQPVEAKKRKKKGRPSLLDLEKRSLRLQKQQQQHQQEQQQQKQQSSNRNPNPNSTPQKPNPYLKFPNRRSTRRNPNPSSAEEATAAAEEEEEEGDSNGKRKEKKLKLVLRIPNGSEDLGGSGSESDGASRKKRKIDTVEQTARQNSKAKATDEAPQGDPSDSGPTTALPDKKLLVFILDRLQKKDTYGVFSEPVDSEELPDYHEIIENPMDFGTVRKKLDSGAYENLEQFESDVFLISSNAMRYNAPDTIYFRQARSIQELAKKDFENLRSESDDNEQEPKTVRRGRPPIKNVMKRIGRPPADRTGPDFSSDATLANARDGTHNSNSTRDVSKKGSSFDKPSIIDSHRGNSHHKSEKNDEYSGSPLKGIPTRNWKKFSALDENRRNTYNQPLLLTGFQEPSVLTTFDGQRKMLMPVGLYMEHAYARSLARFAANLGPIAWDIAAKRIERVLPPGTKFGPGWVGENDAANQFRPPLLSVSPPSSYETKLSQGTTLSGGDKLPGYHKLTSNNSALPPSALASTTTTASRPVKSKTNTESGRLVKPEGNFGLLAGGMHPKSPLQPCKNLTMQHPGNGFNPGYGFNLPSQAAKMAQHTKSPEVAMTHSHALDMVSRSGSNSSFDNQQTSLTQSDEEEKATRPVVSNSVAMNSRSSLPDTNHSSEGQLRVTSLNPKPGSVPPDLNADFHSSGSPVDSKQQKQPDLALQL